MTTEKDAEKFDGQLNYQGKTVFNENLIAVHMGKTVVMIGKPVYVGMSILDISKTLVYEFYYNYAKLKWGDKAKLLFTDTDSLMFEIETKNYWTIWIGQQKISSMQIQ